MECTQSCTYTWQTQNAWTYHKSNFTLQNGSRPKWRLLSWIVDLTYNSDTPVTLKLDGTQNWHSRSCLHWKPMLMFSPKTTSQVDRTEECWLIRFVDNIYFFYRKKKDKTNLCGCSCDFLLQQWQNSSCHYQPFLLTLTFKKKLKSFV